MRVAGQADSAIGVRIKRFPMTAETVLEALDKEVKK
jgi:hypothetical protein